MKNNFGFPIPTEFPPAVRNAIVGEPILFYGSGDPHEVPVLAHVTEVCESPPNPDTDGRPVWMLRCTTFEKDRRPTNKDWTRHMSDPFWNKNQAQKRSLGAWDFHPVYKGVFQKWLNAFQAREAKRLQEEAEASSTPPEEVEAMAVLDRVGPQITVIARELGITAERLKDMPEFWEAFKEAQSREFEKKNSKQLQPA